jgi:peptidyl-tRNA hydrolase, PTH1 family
MKLIIGLGNPGNEYDGTRHNVGFAAVDTFADDFDGSWTNDAKRKATVSKTTVGKTQVILAKPTTFMNLSGEAVQALVSFYKVKPEELLVVQDDMDLAPGTLKFTAAGGPAGHNGIISVQERLGTVNVARLRLGIGHPTDKKADADYVLGPLSPEDAPNALDVSTAMRDWIEGGLEKASRAWNGRKG